ncbi:hypothetical protein CCACVL1_19059, partial [Corchorus capsularis]
GNNTRNVEDSKVQGNIPASHNACADTGSSIDNSS